MKGNYYYLIALVPLSAVVVLFAMYFFAGYSPGMRVKFFGARNYRIKFKYAKVDVFGPGCEKQLSDLMYWLERVVNHICLYELKEYYFTKEEVQSLAEEYYNNLHALYAIKEGVKKGRLDKGEYRISLDFFKGRTTKAIDDLRKLNKELVQKINEQDDARERELLKDQAEQKYSWC
ncbi:hypothetical protein IKE97_01080 [Candidatus Saccharibacteria bacterium]|nr:hypothetical protein [Candidatus Saccharibacteria bacterium]